MKVLGKILLSEFAHTYGDALNWIENWIADVEAADWSSPHDVRERYNTASFLKGGLMVFNVRGNNYRLEVQIAYQTKIVQVIWIGTHAQYDERNRRGR